VAFVRLVVHLSPAMTRRPVLDSLDATYDAAVQMLARKARTSAEVRNELLAHGASEEDVESVLGRLKAHRHLDDAELASDEAFSLLESKGLAPELAVYKLTERGLPDSQAREAVEGAREGLSESQLCQRALERRLKGKALAPSGAAKEGRALARLGYDEEVIARTLEWALGGRTEE
jgi:SOS response regulatory protein OraA/RecX